MGKVFTLLEQVCEEVGQLCHREASPGEGEVVEATEHLGQARL